MNLKLTLPVLSLTTVLGCDQGEKILAPDLSKERTEISEEVRLTQTTEIQDSISLGNVKFRISDRSQALTLEKRKELFENLEKAYQVLLTYFGEKLMTAVEPMEVPTRVKLTKNSENAEIVWKNYADTNDACNIAKIEPHELVLETLSTDVLAHELFHLFQLHGYMESKMFVEGQAHALIALLFDKPASWTSNQDRIDEMSMSTHQSVLNKPWDYAFCQDVIPENPSTKTMEMLIRTKHATLWIQFLKENPNFLRDFYKKIADLRGKRDRAYFTHTDLVKIASSVSPNFMPWYQTNPVLHSLQERTEEETTLIWTPLGENRLGLFNFEVERDAKGVMKVRQATQDNQMATFRADLASEEVFTGQFIATGLYQSVNIRRPFVESSAVKKSKLTIGEQTVQKVSR